jgi:hypothetical protein
MKDDAAYYSRRALVERTAAMKAAHPNVRQVHLEMAEAYEQRVRSMTADDRRSALQIISAA